jgi:FMN reductase
MTKTIHSDAEPKRLVVVSAGTGDPSSTRQLTDRIAQKTLARLRAAETEASSSVIELGPLAVDIARATTAGFPNQQLQAAIDRSPPPTRSSPPRPSTRPA